MNDERMLLRHMVATIAYRGGKALSGCSRRIWILPGCSRLTQRRRNPFAHGRPLRVGTRIDRWGASLE